MSGSRSPTENQGGNHIQIYKRRLFFLHTGVGESWIESISQTIAKQVESEHRDHDRQSREENEMRCAEHLIALAG